MKHQKPILAIGLVSVALLVALLSTYAQDRPTVLPPEPVTILAQTTKSTSKSPTPYPFQAQPLPKKTKPDPTLIIPAEVYDVPRPIVPPVELKPEIVPAGGPLPAPASPPVINAVVEPKKNVPAPLPLKETKPAPLPEPTKALIVDPPTKDLGTRGFVEIAPPALDPKSKKAPSPLPSIVSPPALDPEPKKAPSPLPGIVSPPVLDPEPKKVATPLPSIVPPPVLEPEPKRVPPPLPFNVSPPILEPEPKKASMPVIVSPIKQEPIAPALPSTVNDPPQVEKPKSFIRIRSGETAPTPIHDTVAPMVPQPIGTAPMPISSGALATVQTPGVVLEKRGPSSLRAGETQMYQIVVRNVGGAMAQQVRIEDDLPADVRLLNAEPMPQMQGARAIWTLPILAAGGEQSIRLTLKADANVQLTSSLSVHVSAANIATRVASSPGPFSIRLSGPERVSVGKPAVFEIYVSNPTRQPLTGIVLHGDLSDGLTTPAGNRIEGDVKETIAPGDFKILKMPATAVKAGRYTIHAKVVTQAGEASASTSIDVGGDSLLVQTAPMTRLPMGRDGDLRIDIANQTGKPLKNVTVANLLPDGCTFVGASDRGLYQSNARTVYWLIENMPVGASKTLVVRVIGSKTGQLQSLVSARADGIAEVRVAGAVVFEHVANLTLRVIDRDNPLELGRDTVYEVQVQNPGNSPASNVQVNVQFPPGLVPKSAQGAKYSLEGQSVTFEPIATIAPQGQAIVRVSAQAKTVGNDQRVRFQVVSDAMRTPIQREIGVMVYSGN